MIKKFAEVLKYLGVVTGILIGVISCENDFKNVGVNIVDNNVFSTDKIELEVIAYNRDILRNQSNGLNHYLLGVQRDEFFGKLETSIVAQLSLPEINYEYGLNAVIDTVIVDIPYLATLDGKQTYLDDEGIEHSVPNFVLDSIWPRDNSGNFTLNVFELGTYLTNIDNNDPTKPRKYYSDATFTKINPTNPLYSGLVTPNPNDTMLIVKRYKNLDLPIREVYQIDTLKSASQLNPSLKIAFDYNLISPIFQNNAGGSEFSNEVNFQHFFRGLYFEALENETENSSLMTLDFSQASMTIYFSYDEHETEGEGEDLNGNGINAEGAVLVRTPSSFIFKFNRIKTNLYKRDDSGSLVENFLNNANETDGEDKLFVQGAAGSDAVIKLFGEDNENGIPENLEMLRGKNWLINDAQLVFYIDQDNLTNWVPERLYLYHHYVNEDGDEENTQVIDAMPQSLESIGGELQRDSDGNPEKYVFHITEYISEIIKPDSEFPVYDLGVKVFNENDIPSYQVTDTILKEFNTNPKGIILKGNIPNTNEDRIKLEIYYSEKN